MLQKTIMSGIGGQGILFSGLAFAWAAMLEGHHVTYLPSYGAEMRGGITSCTIAISDEEIASPVASSPDYLVIMDNLSLQRLQNQTVSGGQVFINTSIVTTRPVRGDIEVVDVPVNELAIRTVGERYANMVMLGAFVSRTRLIKISTLIDNMEEILGKGKSRFKDKNIDALRTGYDFFSRET
ncbi:MAG: 2-oxoacid:acceptor oxidoreductase family protein [Desulfomonilia bacterium]|jgi:2-oxoglutarate ferredoxin oxidoreductase subunit gamma|uniref:Pyruvate synthase subunit PorC n=1 Tax=anaerobic digester metagenome TaxID=1263854 RepID=A0A485LYF6_9ZZZZ|nr:2-oxoacid:acceptor oxidoreductase family protein [Pseudomonadota bacterium]HPD20737.1 2-oxoacid:acceptor oxidoreductase family protein [Deltaproteobacteria bacterium]HPX18537.1 2-oxoacid:acceptor oxidoreductase family protein [Deltaproteobacteria bacterium]HRS55020.1 2-oxoacid:acceptor oxidoreductase family protein [Desulfomonilia bacterium]HRV35272.1 2-oxoacid:acceptor oxidoreductase family protein [Desulfomonilia bacterium]